MKKAAFRADASQTIGGGHVMRCLTLADALVNLGCDIHFICRDLRGNLSELILNRGYSCHFIDASDGEDLLISMITKKRWPSLNLCSSRITTGSL